MNNNSKKNSEIQGKIYDLKNSNFKKSTKASYYVKAQFGKKLQVTTEQFYAIKLVDGHNLITDFPANTTIRKHVKNEYLRRLNLLLNKSKKNQTLFKDFNHFSHSNIDKLNINKIQNTYFYIINNI